VYGFYDRIGFIFLDKGKDMCNSGFFYELNEN